MATNETIDKDLEKFNSWITQYLPFLKNKTIRFLLAMVGVLLFALGFTILFSWVLGTSTSYFQEHKKYFDIAFMGILSVVYVVEVLMFRKVLINVLDPTSKLQKGITYFIVILACVLMIILTPFILGLLKLNLDGTTTKLFAFDFGKMSIGIVVLTIMKLLAKLKILANIDVVIIMWLNRIKQLEEMRKEAKDKRIKAKSTKELIKEAKKRTKKQNSSIDVINDRMNK